MVGIRKMVEKIKVAIIGCGQISDAHLSEINLLPDAEIVAVCDLRKVLAEDTAERFGIKKFYCDYNVMIEDLNPDVVHITTPPHTHRPIGLDVIQQGCHAYIEKPFGINYQEARELIEAAKQNRAIVCAGFSQLYDLVSQRLRKYIDEGRLGDVVHVETYYGNSLEGNFSRLFLQNKDHWLHSLPGKLFQNIISHALYHIIPYFPTVIEHVFCFAQDRSKNGVFQDELRVMMQSGDVTAYLTFSSAVKPITQFFRIYGTKSIVHVDLANHLFYSMASSSLPGPVARVRNAFVPAKQLLFEGFNNIRKMVNGNDRFFAGMGNLFKQLHENIREGSIEPPIPYSHILSCSEIMDKISAQCQKIEKNRYSGGG